MQLSRIPQYLTNLKYLTAKDVFKLMFNLPGYYYRRAFGGRYCEKKVNEYKMILDLNDKGITKELMFLGTREKEHHMILKETLKPGMVVLDIGANVGYYAVMMGRMVGATGKIYAVEPEVMNYCMLNLNVSLNGLEDVVDTFNLGISNESGVGEFYRSKKSNWHTFYPTVHTGVETESLVDVSPVEVPVSSIGDFARGRRNIDLIRMDVEGFEVEIIESLLSLLDDETFRPKILFEVHMPRYDDKEHNMRQCLRDVFDKGYYVKDMASNIHDKGGAESFKKRGYEPNDIIKTDFLKRGLYDKVSNEDALELICDTDHVRTVLLVRK